MKYSKILVSCILLAFLFACSMASDLSQVPQEPLFPENGPYKLQPGDTITVQVYGHEDLLVEEAEIPPDGRMRFSLIDKSIPVAGMTVDELADTLTSSYALYLKEFSVGVIVNEYVKGKVFVTGQVEEPGVFEFEGSAPLRLMDSIAMARGLLKTGNENDVIVIRTYEQIRPIYFSIDIEDILENDKPEMNIVLKPGDHVYIPTTGRADVNRFVEQIIRNNLPIDVGMGL
jgi:polysaccharide export outer membrane protein